MGNRPITIKFGEVSKFAAISTQLAGKQLTTAEIFYPDFSYLSIFILLH
jgi:uncharacterized protein Usg